MPTTRVYLEVVHRGMFWTVRLRELTIRRATQARAVALARRLANHLERAGANGDLVLKGLPGRIRWRDSFGTDPRDVRGKT